MKLVYSRQALADIEMIASYYTVNASPAIAMSIKRRLLDVIDRICQAPEAAPRVSQRSQVRAAAVVRYPFRIFYRVRTAPIQSTYCTFGTRRDGLGAGAAKIKLGLAFGKN